MTPVDCSQTAASRNAQCAGRDVRVSDLVPNQVITISLLMDQQYVLRVTVSV